MCHPAPQMPKPLTYRDLDVWKRSMDLVADVYSVTRDFPRSELYGLTDQIRRAAASVPSNIAEGNGRFRVKAQTEIDDFNAQFGTAFDTDDVDTVGGIVLRGFGRLPKRGETVVVDGLRFRVVRADSRRIHTLNVERVAPAAQPAVDA